MLPGSAVTEWRECRPLGRAARYHAYVEAPPSAPCRRCRNHSPARLPARPPADGVKGSLKYDLGVQSAEASLTVDKKMNDNSGTLTLKATYK